MEMKYTEQAVETLDDAGSVIANKNIEIDTIRQRVADLEKDAARYKWLRDHHDSGDEMWFVYGAKSDNLDQDIDEAMKK